MAINHQLDHISEILGIDKLKSDYKPPAIIGPVVKPDDPDRTHSDQDFEVSRKTMLNVLETANDKLSKVIQNAESYQKPSGWEAAATFMKAMSDIAKDLRELHVEKEIKPNNNQINNSAITVNKTIFTGTATQLLAELKKQKEIVIDMVEDIN